MDFIHDRLADGRAIRLLAIVDTHTRECVALEVRPRWTSTDVVEVLRGIVLERKPQRITCDNGSEFSALAMDRWAYYNAVQLDYSRPGKPTDNAFTESLNAMLRRELLNASYFESLDDARRAAAKWRHEYNAEHPHSSLGQRSPQSFALARMAELESQLITQPA